MSIELWKSLNWDWKEEGSGGRKCLQREDKWSAGYVHLTLRGAGNEPQVNELGFPTYPKSIVQGAGKWVCDGGALPSASNITEKIIPSSLSSYLETEPFYEDHLLLLEK